MGDYADVQILFAESDFDPEEREFMALLWDRFFGPAQLIDWKDPDVFQKEAALREKVHADLRLPGQTGTGSSF